MSNTRVAPIQSKVVDSLMRMVKHSRDTGSTDANLVIVGQDGRPTSLLCHVRHFDDAGTANRNFRMSEPTPMNHMIESVV